MKKLYTFALVFAAALFTLSCEKEVEQATVPEEENEEMVRISIRGTLDKEISKTAYDADGKMTWVEGDKVDLILLNEGHVYDLTPITLTAGTPTDEGRTVEFSNLISEHNSPGQYFGMSSWESSGFAIYPSGFAKDNASSGYTNVYIKLPSSISGAANGICLIGTPNSDTAPTNFNFKTAMAVMKVTVNNIPAETATIKLCALDKDYYPVDGDFTLVKDEGVVTIGINNYQGYGNGFQGVNLSTEGFIDSRDFYFNIPVGTFPANKLAIKLEKKDGTSIVTKTIKKELVFTRNECLTIPELNALPFVITEQGFTPKLRYHKTSTQKLRFDVYTEALTPSNYAHKGNWANGNRFTNLNEAYNKGNYTIPTSSFGESGTYYLNYIVFKSTESDNYIPEELTEDGVLSFGSIPIYYIKSDSEKNAITALTVSSNEISTMYAGDNGGPEALWDGNTNTYWHSRYNEGPDVRDDVYGAYIDVTLTNTINTVFSMKYNVRHNGNAQRPYKIVFGYSTDGSSYNRIEGYDMSTTDMRNAIAGAQITLPGVVIPASCKYLRIGITESAQGIISSSSSGKYAAMAELEIYSN